LILLSTLTFIALFSPTLLGDPENFVPANPLVTPVHIQPEWYFLFAYAILRSIPRKLGGVLALFAAILVLFLVPLVHSAGHQTIAFRPLAQAVFWTLIANTLLLT